MLGRSGKLATRLSETEEVQEEGEVGASELEGRAQSLSKGRVATPFQTSVV